MTEDIDNLRLRFSLDIDDMMAFHKHYLENNRSAGKMWNWLKYGGIAIFLIVGLVLSMDSAKADMRPFIWIYLGVVSLLWFIFLPGIMKRVTLRKSRKMLLKQENSIGIGEREIVFSKEFVRTNTGRVEEKLKWEAFVGCTETPAYLMMYVSENQAYVFPKFKLPPHDVERLREIISDHLSGRITELKK